MQCIEKNVLSQKTMKTHFHFTIRKSIPIIPDTINYVVKTTLRRSFHFHRSYKRLIALIDHFDYSSIDDRHRSLRRPIVKRILNRLNDVDFVDASMNRERGKPFSAMNKNRTNSSLSMNFDSTSNTNRTYRRIFFSTSNNLEILPTKVNFLRTKTSNRPNPMTMTMNYDEEYFSTYRIEDVDDDVDYE